MPDLEIANDDIFLRFYKKYQPKLIITEVLLQVRTMQGLKF